MADSIKHTAQSAIQKSLLIINERIVLIPQKTQVMRLVPQKIFSLRSLGLKVSSLE